MLENQWGSRDMTQSKPMKVRVKANRIMPGAARRCMVTVRAGSADRSWATEVR